MTGRLIIRKIMHTRGADAATTRSRACIIFQIIKWSGVNYSAYTMVATPQHIDQIYFKAFVCFLYLNRYCE